MWWEIIMVCGGIISVGSVIVDFIFLMNGIFLPNTLMFIIFLIGAAIIFLGVICGININKPCKKE